ncbi:MAG: PAS domain S-box protein [Pseudomonadota bacterium]
MNLLRKLKLSHRLAALIGLFSLGLIIYGACSFKTLNELKVNGPLYRDIAQGKDLVADALPPPLYIIESYLLTLQLAAAEQPKERIALLRRLAALRRQHEERVRFWLARQPAPELATLLRQADVPAAAFYEEAFETLVPALAARDRTEAALTMRVLQQHYENHRLAVDQLVALAGAQARRNEADAQQRIESATLLLSLMLTGTLGLGVAGAVLVGRSIAVPLREAVVLARRVVSGEQPDPIDNPHRDETGQLLAALNELNLSLNATLAARSASELELRHARQLSEHVIDGASAMVVGLGHAGEVVIFNTAAELATGYRRERILGRRWRELALMPPSARAHWPDPGQPGNRDAPSHTHEQYIVTAAGEERLVTWRHMVLGRQGGAIALLSFGVDITERRRATDGAAREQTL